MWQLMEKFRQKSREKKYLFFIEHLKPQLDDIILNVGSGNGLFLETVYSRKDKIIALDINIESLLDLKRKFQEVTCVVADAKVLPFKEQSIKITFSNAVIEHVGSNNNQQKFADEIRRISQKYYVTSPNKYFPFEFHYRLPFYQFIPKSIQKFLFHKFNIGLWYDKDTWEDINLLSYRKLKKLFPDGIAIKQRITFYPETLICYKTNPAD